MRKEQLIGTWKLHQYDSWIHLRPDGTALCETRNPDGQVQKEAGKWHYVDATHWKLKLIIPPQPDVPGLEDGAIDVSEYEVVSFSPQRMELMLFDHESPFIYERV